MYILIHQLVFHNLTSFVGSNLRQPFCVEFAYSPCAWVSCHSSETPMWLIVYLSLFDCDGLTCPICVLPSSMVQRTDAFSSIIISISTCMIYHCRHQQCKYANTDGSPRRGMHFLILGYFIGYTCSLPVDASQLDAQLNEGWGHTVNNKWLVTTHSVSDLVLKQSFI